MEANESEMGKYQNGTRKTETDNINNGSGNETDNIEILAEDDDDIDNNNNELKSEENDESDDCIDIRDLLALTEDSTFKIGVNRQRENSYQQRYDTIKIFNGFEYNRRLILLCIIFLFEFFLYINGIRNYPYVTFVIALIIFMLFTILLIYGIVKSRSNGIPLAKWFYTLIYQDFGSYDGSIDVGNNNNNDNISDKNLDSHLLFKTDILEKYSLILILLMIYSSLSLILGFIYVVAFDLDYSVCQEAQTENSFPQLSLSNRNACLVGNAPGWPTFGTMLFFLHMIAISRKMPIEFEKSIVKFKCDTILNKYITCKDTFDTFIFENVSQFKNTKLIFNHKDDRYISIVLFIIGLCFWEFVGIYRYNQYTLFFNGNLSLLSMIIYHIYGIIDILTFMYGAFFAIYVYRKYLIPSIIMKGLKNGLLNYIYELKKLGKISNNINYKVISSSGINNNNNKMNLLESIIGWWVLRNYYINVFIHYSTFEFSSIIGTTLIISIVIAYNAFFNNNLALVVRVSFGFGIILVLSYSILLGMTSVRYTNAQTEHVNTLHKIKIQTKYSLYKNRLSDNQSSAITDLIDIISDDIDKNVYSMKIGGINIDKNFMLLLRAFATTIALAFLGEIIGD